MTMNAITRDYLENLFFVVAPEDQGQIIEVAYAPDWEHERVIRRVTDRSGPTVRYEAIGAEHLIGEFQPWNGAPQVAPGTEWQPIR